MTDTAIGSSREHLLRQLRLLTAMAATALLLAGCRDNDVPDAARIQEVLTLSGDSIIQVGDGDTVRVSAQTVAFYSGREWQGAWLNGKRLTSQGQAIHEAIGRAGEDGLSPERYRHDVAERLFAALQGGGSERLPDSLAVRYRAQLDVLLTEGFSRLSRDMVRGTVDPKEAGLDWRIEDDYPREDVVLTRVLNGDDPADIVAALRPAVPYYERMRAALAKYRDAEARGGWPEVPADVTLKEGERHTAVGLLRQRLMVGTDAREAELAGAGAADPDNFDADLKQAVEHFQHRHGIAPDGAVGSATLKELNHTAADRVAEMRLNLDRWRWLPNDLGERFVLVNIAGFEMEVVENGRTIESMDVVVGTRELETPVFADSIQFVVVNPYWNVPDGIRKRKIEPAMAADPMYLVKNDMEIVDGRIRQRPGPKNALGEYKFLFPNEFDVYLHDTPEGHLFSRDARAFSSGCVRIERPRDFARLLLEKQSDRDPDSLDRLLAGGTEQWIKLDRPLPVYLLYFTAWVQEDGTVRFHHDIYGRDEVLSDQVEEKLRDTAPPQTIAGSVS